MSSPLTPPDCADCGRPLFRVEHRASEYLRYRGPAAEEYANIEASEGLGGETTLRCMECGSRLGREAAAFFYERWEVMLRIREANRRGIP